MVKGLLVSSGLVAVTVFVGAVLSSSVVLADDSAVTTTSIIVPSSCTMVGTTDSAHTGSVPNGIYSGGSDYYPDGIGQTTLKVYCNDVAGFSIYAIGYTGEQYSGTNHTKLIGSSTNEAIATGTAESGPTSNWAMKLATNAQATYPITLENGYGSFSAIPDTYTKVATRSGSTDVGDIATGASLTTTYAAYISPTQLADTYTGKVKYTMVHPASEEPLTPQTATAGCINYFANASTAVGTMGCQSISASATSATLLASNFSREGYGFAGWSDAFDYATNANAHFYGPQETITFTAGQYTGSNNGLALYAVWVKSQGNLQDSSKVASVCNGLTAAPTDGTANLASVSAFTDQRDNESYAIAKLADGQCWMIENLRLEADDTKGQNRFDSSVTNESLAQGYGTSSTNGVFSGLANAEFTNFSNSTTANSLYYSGTQSGTATIDIGTSFSPGYRMPRYNNLNTPVSVSSRPRNPTKDTFSQDNTTVGMYSYGNYYTWHAAVADTGSYSEDVSITSTSLCPFGWRLPQGGTRPRIVSDDDNDFWNLVADALNNGILPSNYSEYNKYPAYSDSDEADLLADKLRAFPNNFLYSGAFTGSSAYSRGSYGFYWSSTATGFSLYFDSGYVSPGTNSYHAFYGGSIRCLLLVGS